MRAFFASFAYFFRHHLWTLGLGAGTGFVVVLLGLFGPRFWNYQPKEIWADVGPMAFLALALTLAAVLGSKSLATNEGMRHLRFLAGQGVRWVTAWLAALAASLVLAVACGVLAALPALGALPGLLRPGAPFPAFLLLLAALWALGHLLTAAARARSLWIAWDLVVLGLSVLAWRELAMVLGRFLEPGKASSLAMDTGLVAAVLVVLASLVTVNKGHSHMEEARRWVSWSLWPAVLLPALAALGGFELLIQRAPRHVEAIAGAYPEKSGRFWLLSGESYPWLRLGHRFLWDAQTDRLKILHLPTRDRYGWLWDMQATVAPDLPVAALNPEPGDASVALVRLDTGATTRVSPGLPPETFPCALGPGGQTLVLFVDPQVKGRNEHRRLVAIEAQTAEKIASLELGRSFALCQASPEALEVLEIHYPSEPDPSHEMGLELSLWRLFWHDRTFAKLLSVPLPADYLAATVQRRGNLVLIAARREWGRDATRDTLLWVLDLDGQVLVNRTLPPASTAALTSQGVLLVWPEGDKTHLELVDTGGQRLAATAVPTGGVFGCQTAESEKAAFVVGCNATPQGVAFAAWAPGRATAGAVVRIPEKRVYRWPFKTMASVTWAEPRPQLGGNPVFLLSTGLVAFDPATGTVRQLLPRHQPL
ncbi:MAG: hypothetical protein ACP5NF_07230 [Thermoanaerobaculum sp.]